MTAVEAAPCADRSTTWAAAVSVRRTCRRVDMPATLITHTARLDFDHVGNLCSLKDQRLECGPIPNVMAALSNTGGALCSTPQSFADAHY